MAKEPKVGAGAPKLGVVVEVNVEPVEPKGVLPILLLPVVKGELLPMEPKVVEVAEVAEPNLKLESSLLPNANVGTDEKKTEVLVVVVVVVVAAVDATVVAGLVRKLNVGADVAGVDEKGPVVRLVFAGVVNLSEVMLLARAFEVAVVELVKEDDARVVGVIEKDILVVADVTEDAVVFGNLLKLYPPNAGVLKVFNEMLVGGNFTEGSA